VVRKSPQNTEDTLCSTDSTKQRFCPFFSPKTLICSKIPTYESNDLCSFNEMHEHLRNFNTRKNTLTNAESRKKKKKIKTFNVTEIAPRTFLRRLLYLFKILEPMLKAYSDAIVVIGIFSKSRAMIEKFEKH